MLIFSRCARIGCAAELSQHRASRSRPPRRASTVVVGRQRTRQDERSRSDLLRLHVAKLSNEPSRGEIVSHRRVPSAACEPLCAKAATRASSRSGSRAGFARSTLQGKRPPSLASYAIASPVVVFHPGEMALSSGPASERRTLLDRIALFVDPTSMDHLQRVHGGIALSSAHARGARQRERPSSSAFERSWPSTARR